mmetsp:Transcript_31461/g.66630  ORF Transcript_31461/g.66630 Transcript_31461/m.66630 type:complete len:110 (-) Transcript_31461:477-806(-)
MFLGVQKVLLLIEEVGQHVRPDVGLVAMQCGVFEVFAARYEEEVGEDEQDESTEVRPEGGVHGGTVLDYRVHHFTDDFGFFVGDVFDDHARGGGWEDVPPLNSSAYFLI